MSTTPAPSPGPTSTHGASVGKRDRNARDDLYEQCSDHITEYIASSRWVGSRPSSLDDRRQLVVGHAELLVERPFHRTEISDRPAPRRARRTPVMRRSEGQCAKIVGGDFREMHHPHLTE